MVCPRLTIMAPGLWRTQAHVPSGLRTCSAAMGWESAQIATMLAERILGDGLLTVERDGATGIITGQNTESWGRVPQSRRTCLGGSAGTVFPQTETICRPAEGLQKHVCAALRQITVD